MFNAKRLPTLLAVAATLVVPSGAFAHINDGGPGESGGCHYTDKDGYDIPIDDGQAVIVDGKSVSCSGGTITVSAKVKTVRPIKIKGATLQVKGFRH